MVLRLSFITKTKYLLSSLNWSEIWKRETYERKGKSILGHVSRMTINCCGEHSGKSRAMFKVNIWKARLLWKKKEEQKRVRERNRNLSIRNSLQNGLVKFPGQGNHNEVRSVLSIGIYQKEFRISGCVMVWNSWKHDLHWSTSERYNTIKLICAWK